jgi:hypothetical protein
MNKFRSYSLTQKSDELKKLILENPDLPIVVLAGEESSTGWHSWTFCSSISFCIDEILDCDYCDYNDAVFTDREYLEEHVVDELADEYEDKSEEEFDEAVKRRLEEFEPYWTKVIAIYATN